MYQQGCKVVYGAHGVCNILENEVKRIDRKNVEYYVLQPLEQPETRYYVPTQSAVAVARIKPLLTEQEAERLLQGVGILTQEWIEDENQRKQHYKTLISNGDRGALIGMICELYRYRDKQLSAGRKFHASDENFLRDAEKLIAGEFSYVLNIPKDQIGNYIMRSLHD